MTAKIQMRRDTSANWSNVSNNPVLSDGEIGWDKTNNALKIGDGSLSWNSLSYLGNIPTLSATTNYNTMTATGRYLISDPSATTMTNGPSSPIDIKVTEDGAGCLIVMTFGSSIVQTLYTEGDGTKTPKSYSRVFDGGSSSWRSWVAQSMWGVSSTEGVDFSARNITVVGSATFNGTMTIGDGNADVMSFRDGTVSAPVITHQGDLDTGIHFPSAGNQIVLGTNGVAAITIGSSQGVTLASNLSMPNGTLTCGPIEATIGQCAIVAVDGTTVHVQVSGTSTTGLFTNSTTGISNLKSSVGTWTGIASGSAGFVKIVVTSSTCTVTTINGGTAPTNTFWASLIRTA